MSPRCLSWILMCSFFATSTNLSAQRVENGDYLRPTSEVSTVNYTDDARTRVLARIALARGTFSADRLLNRAVNLDRNEILVSFSTRKNLQEIMDYASWVRGTITELHRSVGDDALSIGIDGTTISTITSQKLLHDFKSYLAIRYRECSAELARLEDRKFPAALTRAQRNLANTQQAIAEAEYGRLGFDGVQITVPADSLARVETNFAGETILSAEFNGGRQRRFAISLDVLREGDSNARQVY